jgi:hypothetical protein
MTPDDAWLPDDDALEDVHALVGELVGELESGRRELRRLHAAFDDIDTREKEFTLPLVHASFMIPDDDDDDTITELGRLNRRLAIENACLIEDNAHLAAVARDHDAALQIVMNKFRQAAHEIQRSKLGMQRKYEKLLEEERLKLEKILAENATLQTRLARLGALVAEAFESQSDLETDILIESLEGENRGLREMMGAATGSTLPPGVDGRDTEGDALRFERLIKLVRRHSKNRAHAREAVEHEDVPQEDA